MPRAFSLIELRVVRKREAFTLIELLVVVTIIVVLLALLSPAIDRAVYEAELAVCASHQRDIGVGLLGYATTARRYYPYRASVQDVNNAWRPILLHAGQYPFTPYDERLILTDFLNINGDLTCPLSGKIDLANSDPASWTYSNYCLWFSWQYHPSGVRQPGMFRMGDRFEWNGEKFNYLSCDWNAVYEENNTAQCTHPDYGDEARMSFMRVQDLDAYVGGAVKNTFSYWWTPTSATMHKGAVDVNCLPDDGSVVRYNKVTWDDARMVRAPEQSGQQTATWWLYLPRQGAR